MPNSVRLNLFPVVVLAAATANAAPVPNYSGNPAPAAIQATLDSQLIAYMQNGNIPGLASIVVKDGQVKWLQTYGILNRNVSETLESNKVGIDTPFRVASVSKAVTSAIMLRMAEVGYFPSSYVDQYLPVDFPVVNPGFPATRITLTHLLTHTSSIADPRTPYFPPPNMSDATVASMAASAATGTLAYTDPLVASWIGTASTSTTVGTGDARYFVGGSTASDGPLSLEQYLRRILVPGGADYPIPSFSPNRSYGPFQPGTQYVYSNVNFALAGHVIERAAAATGQNLSFAQIADAVLFAPLGMTRSSFSLNTTSSTTLAETALPHAVVTNAEVISQKLLVNKICIAVGCTPRYSEAETTSTESAPLIQYGVTERPAKGLRTSIRDLGALVSMLASGGSYNNQQILAASTVNAMTTIQTSNVGLGLFKFQLAPAAETNDNVWGHSGEDGGVAACMLFSKVSGYGMAIIMNAQDRVKYSCSQLQEVYKVINDANL